ncbi:MAG: ABC transporter permease [Pseudolabrys sp.]|nr:ABC transporter permease [Pseudolabrys sp.]
MTPGTAASLRRWTPLLWIVPAALVLLPFFFLPLVLLFRNSLNRDDPMLLMVPDFTAINYIKALSDPFYLQLFANTIGAALFVAVIATIIAYPFSYFISRYARRSIGLVVWAVYMPLFVSVIVRVFGWMIVLADSGLLNAMLLKLHFLQTPLRLLFEVDGMLIGMVHRYLPLAILPLFNAMKKIPDELHRASANLGATPSGVIRDVVFPLSVPGIVISLQLTFAGALSDFVLPQVLGSPRFRMLAPAIYAEATTNLSTAMAATLAVLMLVFIIALLGASGYLVKRLTPWMTAR